MVRLFQPFFVPSFPVCPVGLNKILLLLLLQTSVILLLLSGAVSCLYFYHKRPDFLIKFHCILLYYT